MEGSYVLQDSSIDGPGRELRRKLVYGIRDILNQQTIEFWMFEIDDYIKGTIDNIVYQSSEENFKLKDEIEVLKNEIEQLKNKNSKLQKSLKNVKVRG